MVFSRVVYEFGDPVEAADGSATVPMSVYVIVKGQRTQAVDVVANLTSAQLAALRSGDPVDIGQGIASMLGHAVIVGGDRLDALAAGGFTLPADDPPAIADVLMAEPAPEPAPEPEPVAPEPAPEPAPPVLDEPAIAVSEPAVEPAVVEPAVVEPAVVEPAVVEPAP